jgi:hypothetical protein
VVTNDRTLLYPAAAIPLVYLADDLIVTVDRDPDAPSPTDPDTNGLEWTHRVTVRSLATREVLWTRPIDPGVRWALPGVRAGSAGIVGLPRGADWMVTSSGSGVVDVWDLRSGATIARRTVGPLDERSYVVALPDAVVVGHQFDDGTGELQAFDPARLRPKWTLAPPLAGAEPVSCQPELCLVSRRAVWMVDPHTALVTARITGTEVVPGPPGLALVAPYGQDPAVVVTDDGMSIALGDVWRIVDAGLYQPTMVMAQIHAAGRADLGLLDVRAARVTRLGEATQWSPFNACLAVAQTIACDSGDTLNVWRRPLP